MPAPWTAGAQVRIRGRIHGQQTVNVLHFATNLGWSVDTIHVNLEALAQHVLECLVQTLLPVVTSDWTLEGVDAKGIYPQTTDEVTVVPAGASAGQKSPVSTSFEATLMHIRTGGGGKSGRGRNFLPPSGEAEIANSIIDGPTLILWANFLTCLTNKFIGAAPSTEFRLGVFSRKIFGGILGNFDNAFREGKNLSVSNVVAVMGTRKVGRGS